MPQYDNPASFLPDAGQFSSPSLSGFAGGMRMMQAQPFLKELLQQQQMNTQQQGQELQEFLSPQGQQYRQAQRQKIIDEGDVYSKTKQGLIDVTNEKNRLESQYLTPQHIEEAKNATALLKHEGAIQPLKYFSGLFPALEKLPEEQRGPAYNSLVQNSGFDVNKLDDDVKQWGPNTMGHLAAVRYAMLHDVEQQKKETLAEIPASASVQSARIHAGATVQATKMNIDAGRYGDMPRQVAALEKALRTGLSPDTGRPMDDKERQDVTDTLNRVRSDKYLDLVNKDPNVVSFRDSAAVARMAALMNPNQQQRQQQLDLIDQEEGKVWQNAVARHGAGRLVPPSGKDQKIQEFKDEAEATKANLPKGTRIKIGGRMATVR